MTITDNTKGITETDWEQWEKEDRQNPLMDGFVPYFRKTRGRMQALRFLRNKLEQELRQTSKLAAQSELYFEALKGLRYCWRKDSKQGERLWFFVRKTPLEFARDWKKYIQSIAVCWITDIVSSRECLNPENAPYLSRLCCGGDIERSAHCPACSAFSPVVGSYARIQEDHQDIWQMVLYAMCFDCELCSVLVSREETEPFLDNHMPAPI